VPRVAVNTPPATALRLREAAEAMEAALLEADLAAGRLAELLREAKAEGYSVRALAEDSGLSLKRVRLLLR